MHGNRHKIGTQYREPIEDKKHNIGIFNPSRQIILHVQKKEKMREVEEKKA